MEKVDPLKLLQREVDKAGSIRALARKIGITDVYIGDVLNRGKAPGQKIQAYLGITRHEKTWYTKP